MGEVAEMMLDGTLCQRCGVFLDGDSPGYPRYCEDCAKDEVQQDIEEIGKYLMKRKAIIVDIDGCLLDNSKLYLEMEKKFKTTDLGEVDSAPWNFFHANCNNADYVSKVPEIFNLVNYYNQNGYAIIVLTARRDLVAKATLHYLLKGQTKLDNISMLICRPANEEGTVSFIYKYNETKKLQKYYDIELAIDDEPDNCEMFINLGITTLQVRSVKKMTDKEEKLIKLIKSGV